MAVGEGRESTADMMAPDRGFEGIVDERCVLRDPVRSPRPRHVIGAVELQARVDGPIDRLTDQQRGAQAVDDLRGADTPLTGLGHGRHRAAGESIREGHLSPCRHDERAGDAAVVLLALEREHAARADVERDDDVGRGGVAPRGVPGSLVVDRGGERRLLDVREEERRPGVLRAGRGQGGRRDLIAAGRERPPG